MSYPHRLLPQPHFRIIDFDRVNLQLRYLVRHTESAQIWDEEGFLIGDFVATESNYNHLRDFSTNLLGEFTVEDIGWKLLNPVIWQRIWQTNDTPFVPTPEEDVIYISGRGSFFLHMQNCHDAPLNISLHINQQAGEEKVVCRILHTPNLLNFWHCSLRWYCNDEDSEIWSKGRLKRMKMNIRSFIIDRAIRKEPAYQAIDPENYQ